MNHETLIRIGLGYRGTSLRYPFGESPAVLYVGEKMFALFGSYQGIASMNLKTSPNEVWITRETYPGTVLPGYHMNKQHWNTVLLNGVVPDTIVVEMLEESYQRVLAKLSKSERAKILKNPEDEKSL